MGGEDDRRALRALADAAGILPEYIDQTGTQRRQTSDATRKRLLAALRYEVPGEADADRAIAARQGELPAGLPRPCPTLADLGLPPLVGITANLYTIRSARNWGVGDLGDLAALARLAGTWGVDFVGVNPLHVSRNIDAEISPYGPVSRLFRNPIYLAIEMIPELARSEEARSIIGSRATQTELARLRASDRVEYERVMALKWRVLDALHDAFTTELADHGARAASYLEYRAAHEPALSIFAGWSALDEHFRAQGIFGGWREWPERYHDPGGEAVLAFVDEHRARVDRHRYVQFLLDEQLGAAAGAAREAGLRIGLYQDLAIGAIAGGSDEWMHPELFVRGVALGAPPDEYARQGQNWGLPPLDPRALRASGFEYWRSLLRSALEHSGAIRIDHVLGLFRQFWIPEGCEGSDGAYVRFPTAEMLGVLSDEATRAGAIVVGEDLGTVPPEVPPTLERWGIYSSKVFYFEREHDTGFKPASSYPARAFATANTHDMATVAGFWRGNDIEVRASVGLLDRRAVEEQRSRRERERRDLVRRLRGDGYLAASDPDEAALVSAIHRLLCASPAELVGVSLDDLVGEERPVNVPGVGLDRFPSWQRRLRPTLDAIAADPGVPERIGCHARRRAR